MNFGYPQRVILFRNVPSPSRWMSFLNRIDRFDSVDDDHVNMQLWHRNLSKNLPTLTWESVKVPEWHPWGLAKRWCSGTFLHTASSCCMPSSPAKRPIFPLTRETNRPTQPPRLGPARPPRSSGQFAPPIATPSATVWMGPLWLQRWVQELFNTRR